MDAEDPTDPRIDDAPGAVATDEPPFDPSTIRDPLPQPLFSVRRLVIAIVLIAAFAALFVAFRDGSDPRDTVAGSSAIVQYTPDPGGRVLRQSEVGVELEDGYDGRLTIDGVEIPEEQMVGAIDPESEEFQQLPDDLRDLGPRPNKKNVVKFQPGPGKAITEYDTGTVEVTVRFWRIADGPTTAETTTYTIRVF